MVTMCQSCGSIPASCVRDLADQGMGPVAVCNPCDTTLSRKNLADNIRTKLSANIRIRLSTRKSG